MKHRHPSIHKHMRLARHMATFLDTQFGVGKLRFGLDPIISLIPGIGSLVSTGLSVYLLWIAFVLNVPKHLYIRMAMNITLDFLLGVVPVVGNVADFFYKANIKNLELLEEHVGKHMPLEGKLL